MSKKRSNIFNDLFPDLTDADILESDLKHQISKMIRDRRHELHMTQKEFADYMEVSQALVSRWESFSYNFSLKCIAIICDKLDIQISFKTSSNTEDYLACAENDFFDVPRYISNLNPAAA